MIGYDNGSWEVSLGTNVWSGLHEQQTGIIGFRKGDFSLSYENVMVFLLVLAKGIHLGDNHDRWRTAAMRFGIGDCSSIEAVILQS